MSKWRRVGYGKVPKWRLRREGVEMEACWVRKDVEMEVEMGTERSSSCGPFLGRKDPEKSSMFNTSLFFPARKEGGKRGGK